MGENRINLIRQMPKIEKCPIGDTIRASFDVTVANIPVYKSAKLHKELIEIFNNIDEWISRAMNPEKLSDDNPFA